MVDDYLEALDAAAADLEAERRAELVAEVREHIELALADAVTTNDETVRAILERLGSPAEIVAAETSPDVPMATTPAEIAPLRVTRPRLSTESRALLLLTVGAVVLPFVGPLLGLWVGSASRRWSLTQKRTASLIVLSLLALPFVVLAPAIVAGEWMWVIGTAGWLLPFVPLAGFVAAAYLFVSTSVVLTVSRRP